MARPVDPSQVREQRSAARDERSLGELFAELSNETTTLVRQEVQLAKTELTHKAAQVGKDVGFLAAGGAVLYAGFLAVIAAVILALAHAMPTWLAALVVGVVVLIIGGLLVWSGLNDLRKTSMAPQQTIQTLKEDATWAKDQTS